MKLNFLKSSALVAMIAALAGLGSSAHATDGWYGRGEVGYSFDGQVDFDNRPDVDLDNGWMVDGAIGYAFGKENNTGVRLEGELSYWNNQVDGGQFNGADVSATAGMLNAYVDFNRQGKWQPYLGAGVGYAKIEGDQGANSISDEGVGYQAMAGVGIVLSPQLTMDVGYRYLKVPNLDGDFDGRVSADYTNQAVTLGLRYQFAAPAAPPPPPPPPVVEAPPVQVCPAQDFKVYFEWDRSNLNAAAVDTINAAAARAKACNVSTVRVVGYTDTSGSAKYNIGLSNRRAAVVRDALVSAGIAGSLISTEGLGETNLDKATKDGVKEPLNRRTAVTISFQ